MGIMIKKLWKPFNYGVKIYHYDTLIGIRKILERLTLDLFNNTFTTNTGTPKKPLLDEVNDG